MRTILLSKSDELYLQKCASESEEAGIAYGLIIGQQAESEKVIVVHLAKNVEEDVDVPTVSKIPTEDSTASGNEGSSHSQNAHNLEDIDTQNLSNQWMSAYKMIPGSFEVIGIFVSGTSQDVLNDATFKAGKKLLYEIHNTLMKIHAVCSCEYSSQCEYVFFAYSAESKQASCKSYTHSANGGAFNPMAYRFVEKNFEWYAFESNYELDEVFPIIEPTQKINIEQQFQHAIEAVRRNLLCSEIFIQNEFVSDELSLENYFKARAPKERSSQNLRKAVPSNEILRATIYLPIKCCSSGSQDVIKVRQFNGVIRFSGVISSRVWCNARNLLGDVKRFIRDDVLRSLAARIQVYCDGLTEPNVSDEAIFISEPPRRVYFNLPMGDHHSPIQFSEYIFRGEAPTVAVAQAKQILDLDVNSESIISDLEDLPEDDDLSDFSSDIQSEPSSTHAAKSGRHLTRSMYMLGVSVSLFVLVVSALFHFLLKR